MQQIGPRRLFGGALNSTDSHVPADGAQLYWKTPRIRNSDDSRVPADGTRLYWNTPRVPGKLTVEQSLGYPELGRQPRSKLVVEQAPGLRSKESGLEWTHAQKADDIS